MNKTISERVLGVLEWPAILNELEAKCVTPGGRAITRSLEPLSIDGINLRLKEITELKELMLEGESPDFTGISDVEPLANIARKEGVLSLEDICRIRDFITASNRIIIFLSGNKERLKLISEEFRYLNKLNVLADLLYSSLTDSNELNTGKYPELKNIRDSLNAAKQEIEKKLSGIIRSPSLSQAIQEKTHNIRNERYVVLVKANMKDRVRGTIHDVSASGLTLYVEPDEITGLNNRLIMLERDYNSEVFRILRLLTREIGKYADDISLNLGLLFRLDFLAAASKFSASIKGSEPAISPESVIRLYSARHPLLYLMNPGTVVPNDIFIGNDYNCMIISGANTGGKTVLLKTVGLSCLLAMHGLHIPAGPDSSLGIFANIMADIGDDQSIARSLSTYSGQIVIINEMIRSADKNTLILIHEILVGTNPRQGSILAQAVLERLADTGAVIFATTHYSELKELPSADGRFINASVSFDVDSLRPAFKLRIGIPGTSYAFDIARIYGMDESILKRALDLQDRRETTAEALIENMQKFREEMEEERRKTNELNTGLDKEKTRYLDLQAKLNLAIEEAKNREGIEFIDEINRHRKEISERFKSLQNQNQSEIAGLQQDLKEIQEKVVKNLKRDRKKRFLHKYRPFEPLKAKAGDTVFISSLESTAKIDEVDTVNSTVSVILGNSIKARYKFEDLLSAPAKTRKAKTEPKQRKITGRLEDTEKDIPGVLQTQYNTSDLRGLKVEEAIARLENDLDRMMRSGINTAVIIHGHGTGALKEAVRKHLGYSYYVKNSRPGEYGEGGDGVTIASLKN